MSTRREARARNIELREQEDINMDLCHVETRRPADPQLEYRLGMLSMAVFFAGLLVASAVSIGMAAVGLSAIFFAIAGPGILAWALINALISILPAVMLTIGGCGLICASALLIGSRQARQPDKERQC